MADEGTGSGAGRRPRVLVTDGGSGQNRSAVAAVRALAAAGFAPVVTVSGPGTSLAAASRHCAGTVDVPVVEDAGYAAAVRRELEGDYLTVLPASDAALVALALPGARLVDKSQVSARVRRAGLPVLPECRFADGDALREAAAGLSYPLVVKPEVRTSVDQPPVQRVASAAQVRGLPVAPGPLVVQPYVDEAMSSVSGVVWQGRLVAVVTARYLRTWPVDAGVASALETVEGDRDLEDRLVQVLDGHDGVFQAQFVGPYLVDLNPRVYGSLPLAVKAGANLPGIACELAAGRPVREVRGRPGVAYRWLEGDLRHLRSRLSTGDVAPGGLLASLRPRRGTAHSTESLADPGPALARLRHAIRTRGARS